MLGGIYSNERCPLCGGRLVDNGRTGLPCEDHPQCHATKIFVRFQGVFRRFQSYPEAQRFLTGLRYKFDEGSFDPRDYRADNPLGFENLANQWLAIKKEQVKGSSYTKIRSHMWKACQRWGNANVKEIGYAEIEDLLCSLQGLSDKSKANIKSSLHGFWTWLLKRRVITPDQMPEFPAVSFELAWRKTISKETQQAILEKVYDLSYDLNPKIWLGIKWLATYISIRPGELLSIREGDFELDLGVVLIPHPKEKRAKTVPLLDEDVELIRNMPRGFPAQPFFRHIGGIKGLREGQPFGPKYLYVWWKRACDALGVEEVDLYGGTRHSTARALRELHSPEEIRRATMHSTNKAFERYFRIELEDVRKVYQDTQRAAPNLHRQNGAAQKDNVLKLKR